MRMFNPYKLFRPSPTFMDGFQSPDVEPLAMEQPRRSSIFDELQSLVRDRPEREEPRFLNKLFGSLAGMGASMSPAGMAGGNAVGMRFNPQAFDEAYDSTTFRKYNQNLQDWEDKVGTLREVSKLEFDRDNTERLLRSQEHRERTEDRRLTRQEERDIQLQREGDARIERDRELNEIRRRNQTLRETIASRPNLKSFVGEDGNVWLIDLTKPEAKPIRTEVKTGELSDMEKLQIGLENSLAEIQARGNVEQQNIRARGEETRQTNVERPARNTTAVTAPDRELVRKANEVISEYPELREYIKVDGSQVTVNPVTTSFQTLRPEVAAERRRNYERAFELVYGRKPSGATAAAPADNRIEVIAPDGRRGRIPASQLDAAIAQGYKRAN